MSAVTKFLGHSGVEIVHSPNPSPQIYQADAEYLCRISLIVETLCNLNYLISEDAGDPAKVRLYTRASQERLQTLVQLVLQRLP